MIWSVIARGGLEKATKGRIPDSRERRELALAITGSPFGRRRRGPITEVTPPSYAYCVPESIDNRRLLVFSHFDVNEIFGRAIRTSSHWSALVALLRHEVRGPQTLKVELWCLRQLLNKPDPLLWDMFQGALDEADQLAMRPMVTNGKIRGILISLEDQESLLVRGQLSICEA